MRLDFSTSHNGSTLILSVGIKCSMRDPICDVNHCARQARLRHRSKPSNWYQHPFLQHIALASYNIRS